MAANAGWLRGTVKEVLSGDTLVITGAARGPTPPAEKRLTLASLIAPRLGRRDGSTADEPFAWESREFTRKMVVGKPIIFRVEYALEQAGGREFGSVFLSERENVALALVAAGLAKVRPAGGQQSPFYEDLAKAAEDAEARGVGLWTKDHAKLQAAVRTSASSDEFDAAEMVARLGKGSTVQGIVEAAMSGSMLRVTLLPGLEQATVMVAGVVCPSLSKKSEPVEAEEAGGPPPAAAPQGEPGAREAKYFTESRVLQREVSLTLQGVSQYGVLVAEVRPAGSDAAASVNGDGNGNGAAAASTAAKVTAGGEDDVAFGLLRAGLARCAEWSLGTMPSGAAFRLREAERGARQARVGVWRTYVAPPSASAKLSDDFTGTVIEVPSGDTVVVKDGASGAERRVTLSSIRAPRPGARDRPAEPWGTEARELLRRTLIGKPVAVHMEYTRKVGGAGAEAVAALAAAGSRAGSAAAPPPQRTMAFGTVTTAEGGVNAAELLLRRGLASLVKHRADEERSGAYEALMAAEAEAKAAKAAQWGSKPGVVPRLNDLSAPNSAAKAKSHLPFLQRAGRVHGVVEHVLSGHKVRVFVPKEGVVLAFSPSGVKCPSRGGPGAGSAAAGSTAAGPEPYADEALAFVRERVMQRDVELEVESVDRIGTFLGTLRVPASKLNLGVAILAAGLGKLHPSFEAGRVAGGPELAAAQAAAKAKKLKVWENYDAAAEAAAAAAAAGDADADAEAAQAGTPAVLDVTVTEVADAKTFYVQDANEPRVGFIAAELAALDLDDGAVAAPALLRAGDKCVARFEGDGQWYRAAVEKALTADPTKPQYDVFFMDFGNRQRVGAAGVRPMDASLAAIAPQASHATLAFVKAPSLEDEEGVDAAQMLAELVGGGARLQAEVHGRERLQATGKQWGGAAGVKLSLVLRTAPGKSSVNAQLVEAGLARVAVPKGKSVPCAALDEIKAAEESARNKRIGIWRYGDPGSDSEEEQAWGGRRPRGGAPSSRTR